MDVKQIKALISAQHVQVSIYHKPVLIQLVRAVAFVTFLLTLTSLMNVC